MMAAYAAPEPQAAGHAHLPTQEILMKPLKTAELKSVQRPLTRGRFRSRSHQETVNY